MLVLRGLKIPGIAEVFTQGGERKQYQILVNPTSLLEYGVSLQEVERALQESNINTSGGFAVQGESERPIRILGRLGPQEYRVAEDLKKVPVKRNAARPVLLQDVAEVQDGARDPEVICRADGGPSVGIAIRKQGDANAVDMAELVLAQISALEKQYADQGLHFQVIANTSLFTKKATDAVIHDLFIAVLLVGLVMLLFLHSLRNALIVLISIPTSIVSTFVMMKIFGYSLNLMSLLGLSLAIGILVDDAIVVIENIYRHLEMGKNKVQASYDGRQEIGFTAISITLVDVVIFLPIIFTVGMVPNLLRQFCMTVLTSTLMSLFVSFTLVPWLTSRFGKLHRFSGKNLAGRVVLGFERFIDWLSEGFVTALLSLIHI